MIHRNALSLIATFIFLLTSQSGASAQTTPRAPEKSLPLVSPIFGDNMVLQRGKVNRFRRWRTTLPVRSNSRFHVPIGLVVDALGRTPAEAWTSTEALRPLKDFDIPLAELERLAAGAPEYGNYVMHWYDQYDVGLKGNWEASDVDDSTWKTVDIPGFRRIGRAR